MTLLDRNVCLYLRLFNLKYILSTYIRLGSSVHLFPLLFSLFMFIIFSEMLNIRILKIIKIFPKIINNCLVSYTMHPLKHLEYIYIPAEFYQAHHTLLCEVERVIERGKSQKFK